MKPRLWRSSSKEDDHDRREMFRMIMASNDMRAQDGEVKFPSEMAIRLITTKQEVAMLCAGAIYSRLLSLFCISIDVR